jgi:hypothetical protein
MQRPADAIVTGFTRNATLCEASLAPLRALKNAGVLRRILCVTWTNPAIDSHLAPLANMPDIELLRVPEPKVSGSSYQRGVLYQVANLEAALARIEGDDTVVLKTRPDFIADAHFLNEKITGFDTLCAPYRPAPGDLPLPALPFQAKIWIPWADANQPFFYEDAAFMGLKADLAQLVTPQIDQKIGVLDVSENIYGPFAHVVRFGSPFRKCMPVFGRYFRDYRFFPNDMDYRGKLVPHMQAYSFFWHLVVAHACVLAASFHIDCGEEDDLVLYPNIFNAGADWSSFSSLKVNPPYDNVEAWRATAKAGELHGGVSRLYGRLVDDRWQHSVLAGDVRDLPRASLEGLMRNVAHYKKGSLREEEDRFYAALASHYGHWRNRKAA